MSKRSDIEPTTYPCCDETIVDAAAVSRVRFGLPEVEQLKPLVDIFGALGDATRLRLLLALAAEPLCVCDLAEIAGVTQSAVSHQLRVLRALDLVTFERDGRRAVYRLADDHVASLLAQGREHAEERTGRREAR